MTEDLERELHDALRPLDPSPEFTTRLLASLAGAREVTAKPGRAWLRPLAMAASVLLATSLGWQWHQHQQGEQAHAQLLEALTITSRSLDHAYQTLHSHDAAATEPGG